MDLEAIDASSQQKLEQMDEEFTITAYPNVQENLKLPTEDQVILEELASSTGTLSSLQNLEKDLSFTDQFSWKSHMKKNQGKRMLKQRDSPTVDTKETLQQWMFVDNSYKAHEVHNYLYEALQKSLELDYSNQRASGAPGISGTSGSSQLPPSSLLPSTCIRNISASRQFELTDFMAAQELSPTDSLMQDDSIPDEQIHLFDDKDSRNDHLPKADSRQDWWKPLPEEKRPANPEPTWTFPSSNVSDIENNWASTLVSTYETPAENLLLAKTGDMMAFMKCLLSRCHSPSVPDGGVSQDVHRLDLLTNPEGRSSQSRCQAKNTAFRCPPARKQSAQSFPDEGRYLSYFGLNWLSPGTNKFYIDRHDSLSRRKDVRTHMRILNVVRIKAYSRYGYDYLSKIVLRRADFQEHTIAEKDFKNLYPIDFEDLNLLLLQGHLGHLPGLDKWMLSTAVKLWTRNLVIRQRVEDFQLGIESCQTQLNLTKPGWDATGYKFKHDIHHQVSRRVVVFPIRHNNKKDHKVKRLNSGMNTPFWTQKDVTRNKEFIAAIERRLKTRRIFRNLECFIGGRVHDIDYRLLQRMNESSIFH
ncbi:hypothetical protein Tco_0617746 [Tanacetum coccineum]